MPTRYAGCGMRDAADPAAPHSPESRSAPLRVGGIPADPPGAAPAPHALLTWAPGRLHHPPARWGPARTDGQTGRRQRSGRVQTEGAGGRNSAPKMRHGAGSGVSGGRERVGTSCVFLFFFFCLVVFFPLTLLCSWLGTEPHTKPCGAAAERLRRSPVRSQ